MIPGRKIYGIFGFCSLSHFELCTEVLEEQVMVFVNQIAEIIHQMCHRHGGQVNRSLGGSFLMVWKLRLLEGNNQNGGGERSIVGRDTGERSYATQYHDAHHHHQSRGGAHHSPTHTTTLSLYPFRRTRRASNSSVSGVSIHPTPLSPSNRFSVKPSWTANLNPFDRTINTSTISDHTVSAAPVKQMKQIAEHEIKKEREKREREEP